MELKKYKLGDIADIIPGYAFKSTDFLSGENIVIKIKDIEPPFIDVNNADKVGFRPNDKYRLEYGDFVLAMTGATIGKVGVNNTHIPNVYINQRVCKFIPNEGLCDKNYLYYLLNTDAFRNFIYKNIDSASAQPNIGHPSILKFEHYFPNIEEQKRIGNLLSSLDQKIALNRQINDNLEAMAKQLYDYWFVQFDFPNEEGKPYKSSGGKMVWNDKLKREFPEGWEVDALNKWLEIKSGFPFKSETYLTSGHYKIITIKNVQDGELVTSDCDFVDEIPSRAKDYISLQIGDRLISLTGNCGRLCVVCENNLLLNQRVGLLYCDKLCLEYLYNYLNSRPMRIVVDNLANGAAQANLSPVELCNTMCAMPQESTLLEYNRKANVIRLAMIQNNQEIATLTKQRDELLPLLMNDQVSVNYHLSDD